MKRCNSEYSYQVVRRCRRGYLKNDIFYCGCRRRCAMCSVGGMSFDKEGRGSHKVTIWMHPEMHEEFVKTKKVMENE